MILVADSVMPPSAAQIAAAKAAGYGAWLGGFAGPNILYGWADADFRRVIAGGLLTGAYCSRLADPLAMKARAAGLGIVLIQDDESGIAPFDIAATDAFLVASGASLYGGSQVMSAHYAHAHPAYVYAGYPGGVQTTTWPPGVAAPPQPKGWQWANANLHPQPFGSIDTSNFDPAVLAAPTPTKEDNVTGFLVNYDGGIWIVYITENGLVKQPMLDGALVGGLNGQGFTDLTLTPVQMAAIPNVVYPPVGGAGAPFASTIAGTIEDQGSGKSSLTGSSTPV